MSTTSNRNIQVCYLHPFKPNVGKAKLEFSCGLISLRIVGAVGTPIYPYGYFTTGICLDAYPVSVFLDTETGRFNKTSHLAHFCLKEPFDEATVRVISGISREYNLRLGKSRS
jgi:hypothetical protein